jgi:hypothetical protein
MFAAVVLLVLLVEEVVEIVDVLEQESVVVGFDHELFEVFLIDFLNQFPI